MSKQVAICHPVKISKSSGILSNGEYIEMFLVHNGSSIQGFSGSQGGVNTLKRVLLSGFHIHT